jgi:signal transduction histidine kinase
MTERVASDAAVEAARIDPAADMSAADARLIRSVRLRLVAMSGGSTLLVLLILGLALYLSVASSLEAAGMAILDDRATEITTFIGGGPPSIGESPTDLVFGGGGTFALLVAPGGAVVGPRGFGMPADLPDQDAIAAAADAGRDVRTTTIRVRSFRGGELVSVPVRQLTVSADSSQGQFIVQIVQDRSAELRTLQSLVVVLVAGGLVVVLVAVGFGAMYARRALVPIRDSLAAQRAALRRQREFAADASHELRTPLTVIRSSVEHLRRQRGRPIAEVDEALDDIDAEVEQVTRLVEDLLLLARSDSGAVTLERVPVRLDIVLAEAAAALAQPAAERGIGVAVDPQPVAVVGDPSRLRQLVTILLDNAIRHSPPGGEVRVVARGGVTASLAVEDAGPGVRPEDRDRIFDRFWRAPGAPPGGTGLGLAIARWIAEHHGGSIIVGDAPAGGARFEVRLPAVPAGPEPPT